MSDIVQLLRDLGGFCLALRRWARTRVYVANENSSNISIIDAASKTVIGTVGVGSAPSGITISSDGSRIYVANQGSGSVTVIDAASQSVVTTVSVSGAPLSVAASPDGSRIYVTTQSSQVVVINALTNTVTASVTLSVVAQDVVHVEQGRA